MNLPTHYNALTAKQVEELVRLFDENLPPQMFAYRAFLLLAGLRLCKAATRRGILAGKPGVYYFRKAGAWPWRGVPVKTHELAYYTNMATDAHDKPGRLAWLAEEPNRVMPVYTTLRLRAKPWHLCPTLFNGPAVYMQDFTWRQYKYAGDYLDLYTANPTPLNRGRWLAVMFSPRVKHVSPTTGRTVSEYLFTPGQVERYAPAFARLPEVKFKAMLLFWNSVAAWLARSFPHLFKENGKEKKNKQGRQKRIDLVKSEAQLTETLCSRMNLTAEQVYAEPYTRVLENLERLSVEAEEAKKQLKV